MLASCQYPWDISLRLVRVPCCSYCPYLLGYVCNSVRQAFLLPPDKRAKFSALRGSILEHKTVSFKNLQKFGGKPHLLPCWFLLPSCTPILSSRPSPAPLPWPLCSFALRPNLGKNFCIGGFSILGRGVSLGRASAIFSLACIRMLPTLDGVVALSSQVSPLQKPTACGMWSPVPCLLQSMNLWLFFALWRA